MILAIVGAMKDPKTLLEAIQYFSDEQVCIAAVAAMRWPDGKPVCPVCREAKGAYYLATQKRWKCKHCRHQFSVKVNTILEDSPIPLQKWLPALWQLVNCKNGVSSHELGKTLGITQKSAWFVLHRLRLALQSRDFSSKLGSNDGGEVEIDESFVGGKLRNMHRSRRVRYAQQHQGVASGFVGKTVVLGMLDRESRQVRAQVVPDVKRETLQKEILNNVKFGSRIYTDDAVRYDSLAHKYIHETVNHAVQYVRGQVST